MTLVRVVLILTLAPALILAASPPAGALPAGAIGSAQVPLRDCPGSLPTIVEITGFRSSSSWSFIVVVGSTPCFGGGTLGYSGLWDPATGGCVMSATGHLCLTNPRPGLTTRYDAELYDLLGFVCACGTGPADMVIASV